MFVDEDRLVLAKYTVSLKFNCPLNDKQREDGVGDASWHVVIIKILLSL